MNPYLMIFFSAVAWRSKGSTIEQFLKKNELVYASNLTPVIICNHFDFHTLYQGYINRFYHNNNTTSQNREKVTA